MCALYEVLITVLVVPLQQQQQPPAVFHTWVKRSKVLTLKSPLRPPRFCFALKAWKSTTLRASLYITSLLYNCVVDLKLFPIYNSNTVVKSDLQLLRKCWTVFKLPISLSFSEILINNLLYCVHIYECEVLEAVTFVVQHIMCLYVCLYDLANRFKPGVCRARAPLRCLYSGSWERGCRETEKNSPQG